MDVVAAYVEHLLNALRNDPDRFAELLRKRWAGDDGPPLDTDRSWSDLLFFAYDETPDEDRDVWATAVCDVFDEFPARRILNLDLRERLVLLGALDLAQAIDWSGTKGVLVDVFLTCGLQLARSKEFPAVRDLYKEDDFFGQPEQDVVAALLRLAVRRLDWNDQAEACWELALADGSLPADVLAGRLWEVARWAIAAKEYKWLGRRLDVLDEKLEAANNVPGNLTRLFFLAEYESGPIALAKILVEAFRSLNPIDREQRQNLANKLDYFGTSQPEIRESFWRLKGEHAGPLPDDIKKGITDIQRAFSKNKPSLVMNFEERLEKAAA